MKKMPKLVTAIAAAGVLSLSFASVAMGADVSVTDTGPFSTNNATVTNSHTLTTTNTNDVDVINVNNQTHYLSALLLGGAALLSLIGAGATALYTKRTVKA